MKKIKKQSLKPGISLLESSSVAHAIELKISSGLTYQMNPNQYGCNDNDKRNLNQEESYFFINPNHKTKPFGIFTSFTENLPISDTLSVAPKIIHTSIEYKEISENQDIKIIPSKILEKVFSSDPSWQIEKLNVNHKNSQEAIIENDQVLEKYVREEKKTFYRAYEKHKFFLTSKHNFQFYGFLLSAKYDTYRNKALSSIGMDKNQENIKIKSQNNKNSIINQSKVHNIENTTHKERDEVYKMIRERKGIQFFDWRRKLEIRLKTQFKTNANLPFEGGISYS